MEYTQEIIKGKMGKVVVRQKSKEFLYKKVAMPLQLVGT
jgi:hypothetical protein